MGSVVRTRFDAVAHFVAARHSILTRVCCRPLEISVDEALIQVRLKHSRGTAPLAKSRALPFPAAFFDVDVLTSWAM